MGVTGSFGGNPAAAPRILALVCRLHGVCNARERQIGAVCPLIQYLKEIEHRRLAAVHIDAKKTASSPRLERCKNSCLQRTRQKMLETRFAKTASHNQHKKNSLPRDRGNALRILPFSICFYYYL